MESEADDFAAERVKSSGKDSFAAATEDLSRLLRFGSIVYRF